MRDAAGSAAAPAARCRNLRRGSFITCSLIQKADAIISVEGLGCHTSRAYDTMDTIYETITRYLDDIADASTFNNFDRSFRGALLREPGIHNPDAFRIIPACGYGFRAPRGKARPPTGRANNFFSWFVFVCT